MKKFLALCFVFVFLTNVLAVPLFAAEANSQETVIVDYVSDANEMARGASKPKKSYDLSSGTYRIDGQFEVGVYTNYKFKPSADGKLAFSFTVDYNTEDGMFFDQREMTIEMYRDEFFDVRVYNRTIKMEPHPLDPTQYDAVITHSYIAEGLETDKEYYFRISKTGDGLDALLSGYVKHPD